MGNQQFPEVSYTEMCLSLMVEPHKQGENATYFHYDDTWTLSPLLSLKTLLVGKVNGLICLLSSSLRPSGTGRYHTGAKVDG